MNAGLKLALVFLVAGIGFLLMFPLAALFNRMSWPVFNTWALGHGTWVIAWPLLGWAVFAASWPLARRTFPLVTSGGVLQGDLHVASVLHFVVAGISLLAFVRFTLSNVGTDFSSAGDAGLVALAILYWSAGLALFIYGVLMTAAARFLWRRRHLTFCKAMAGVSLLFIPFGTLLGVFTLRLLGRESVRSMFSPSGDTRQR